MNGIGVLARLILEAIGVQSIESPKSQRVPID
jgi:hypothetical protein